LRVVGDPRRAVLHGADDVFGPSIGALLRGNVVERTDGSQPPSSDASRHASIPDHTR
jgi:hypothetical protein